MIRLHNIRKSYYLGSRPIDVLKGIDMHIAEGEMVAIMGASGSGKSTLLNILGILDSYDHGEYRLAGKLVRNLSESEAAVFRNRHIGFVFQAFNLLPFKTALENVALPLYYQKIPRLERNRIAFDYLRQVGLQDRAEHLPSELSGGQKQRVAIARALVSDPRIILADEPTGSLDSASSAEIMSIFRQINGAGRTVIIVTHEHEVAAQADRIIAIKDGLIIDSNAMPRKAAAEEAVHD
jgi:putative ABC transport system ATP-binding protein